MRKWVRMSGSSGSPEEVMRHERMDEGGVERDERMRAEG